MYTWWIHSLALSQMMVRTHRDRFVATRWINPNLDMENVNIGNSTLERERAGDRERERSDNRSLERKRDKERAKDFFYTLMMRVYI